MLSTLSRKASRYLGALPIEEAASEVASIAKDLEREDSAVAHLYSPAVYALKRSDFLGNYAATKNAVYSLSWLVSTGRIDPGLVVSVPAKEVVRIALEVAKDTDGVSSQAEAWKKAILSASVKASSLPELAFQGADWVGVASGSKFSILYNDSGASSLVINREVGSAAKLYKVVKAGKEDFGKMSFNAVRKYLDSKKIQWRYG